MNITVEKLTDVGLMQEACEFTMNHKGSSSISLENIYQCEHSPMRTQLFIIRMYGIPAYVSTHLVRHSAVGQQHYVGSHREDRGGAVGADRYTPVDHMMVLNAQHLVDMSHQRLCFKASSDTTQVMMKIAEGVADVDPDLNGVMVPKCHYLDRCPELKSCGYWGDKG